MVLLYDSRQHENRARPQGSGAGSSNRGPTTRATVPARLRRGRDRERFLLWANSLDAECRRTSLNLDGAAVGEDGTQREWGRPGDGEFSVSSQGLIPAWSRWAKSCRRENALGGETPAAASAGRRSAPDRYSSRVAMRSPPRSRLPRSVRETAIQPAPGTAPAHGLRGMIGVSIFPPPEHVPRGTVVAFRKSRPAVHGLPRRASGCGAGTVDPFGAGRTMRRRPPEFHSS